MNFLDKKIPKGGRLKERMTMQQNATDNGVLDKFAPCGRKTREDPFGRQERNNFPSKTKVEAGNLLWYHPGFMCRSFNENIIIHSKKCYAKHD